MKASATKKNGVLHFYFEGELDEHAARQIRRRIDAFIDENAAAESVVRKAASKTHSDESALPCANSARTETGSHSTCARPARNENFSRTTYSANGLKYWTAQTIMKKSDANARVLAKTPSRANIPPATQNAR